MSERLERLAKLRALLEAHHCELCDRGVSCGWRLRAANAILTVELQADDEPAPVKPTPEKRALKPGDPGYMGHRVGRGLPRKIWHPLSRRNLKKLYRNREMWPLFRDTAGIDGRITFESAWKRAKIHEYTLAHIVNGLTDTKFSTVLDFCDGMGCSLAGFAKAIRQAWEIAERRNRAEEAIKEARGE